MLVGDLIMNVRSLGPDMPQVLPPPVINSLTPTTGGTLGPGTYYIVMTMFTPWGESLPSAESSVTLAGPNNAIQISFSNLALSTGTFRIYVGFTSGQEVFYFQVGPNPTQFSPYTLLSNAGQTAGVPPVRSSAWLPDTDGGFVSASTFYAWMNDALRAASRIAGGIQDATGIFSTSGNRRYVAIGQWLKFDQCFYDGWELDLGNKAETFRNRNLTANIAISLMVDAQSDTTRIELYWTPSRTSGSATTTGPITSTTNIIPITGVSNWLLADGYALIQDNLGNGEIITYSAQSASQLSGVIRGWAGTQPFAFGVGSTIRELNIELNGYRMPFLYSVGQSQSVLGVPPGWEPFLKDYLLGNFRKAEQETEEGIKLQQSAAQGLEAWVKSNKPVAGPRQMRMYGDFGLRGTVPGGLTGPIIIP